jgi:hypothetical protein
LIPLFSGTFADKYGFKKMLIIAYLAYLPSILLLIVTESFIGLEKMFFGPGERGKDKPGRMPITLVSTKTEESLGFSFKGKPHYIPQIVINNNLKKVNIRRDYNIQSNKDIENLCTAIRNFNNKYTLLEAKPTMSKFLIGLYKNRLFISVDDKNKIKEYVEYIQNKVIDGIDYSKAKESLDEQPQFVLKMTVDMNDNARVFAKTALNIIADLKGLEYLNNQSFNEIKDWILGQDNDKFKQIPQLSDFFKFLNIKNRTHYCAIMNIDGKLAAFIVFYNHWTMAFEICKSFDDFFNMPYCFFCDWENKKEFTLIDYLRDIGD